MSVSGGYFSLEDFFSPARFNRKMPSHLSGSQIATLTPTYPNQLVVCNVTETGFTADTAYLRNSANTAWIGLTSGKHQHDADTEAAGGLLSDIFYANIGKVLWINDINPSVGVFQTDSASGGTASDDAANGRVTIATGTTNGGYAHIGRSGVKLDFAKASRFGFKGNANANTNVSIRLGVAMENVNSGLDVLRKYGLEACDSAGTARTFDVISADGTTRSATASTEDVTQASPRYYRLDYTVAQDVKYYVNSVLLVTKTTNVPSTSRSAGIYNTGAGLKSNNTTGKNLFIYGMSLAGAINDEVWV